MKSTIVFIHGMFQNPKSWERWIDYFQSSGYNCIAPAWPYHEGEPADLRQSVPEGLGDLKLEDIIQKYETLIYSLPEKPIVIGHSVGGLIVQRLVNLEIVKAGVAISSVAPNGMVTFDWSFVKNAAVIANPLKGDDPICMDLETFKEAFANTLPEESAEAYYEATATHDSRNVFRGCMGTHGELDVDTPHPPLLLIGGKEDKICPSDLNQKNAEAYTDAESITEIKIFPARSHFICNEPGWEEVAAYALNWIQLHEIQAHSPIGNTQL